MKWNLITEETTTAIEDWEGIFIPEIKKESTLESTLSDSLGEEDDTKYSNLTWKKDSCVHSQPEQSISKAKTVNDLKEENSVPRLLFTEGDNTLKTRILEEDKDDIKRRVRSTKESSQGSSNFPPQFGETQTMSAYILKTCDYLVKRQEAIDEGWFSSSGPGRKRRNPYRKTSELQDLIWNNFYEFLLRQCGKKASRKDAFMTYFLRKVKKLPYFLVRNCSSQSIYKKPEMESFILSFLEAYQAFWALVDYDNFTSVEDFADFWMLYFPVDKCNLIIDHLHQEGYTSRWVGKLRMCLHYRDTTSKKDLFGYLAPSRAWRIVFALVKEVLMDKEFPKSDNSQSLLRWAEEFLSI